MLLSLFKGVTDIHIPGAHMSQTGRLHLQPVGGCRLCGGGTVSTTLAL